MLLQCNHELRHGLVLWLLHVDHRHPSVELGIDLLKLLIHKLKCCLEVCHTLQGCLEPVPHLSIHGCLEVNHLVCHRSLAEAGGLEPVFDSLHPASDFLRLHCLGEISWFEGGDIFDCLLGGTTSSSCAHGLALHFLCELIHLFLQIIIVCHSIHELLLGLLFCSL